VEIGSLVWSVRVAEKDKTKKINERHASRIISYNVRGVPADTIPTKLVGVVDLRDVITHAKCEIKLFIIVTLVNG